jgi:ribosomal protein S24E
MTINNLLNVKSRDELREWLMHNYDKEMSSVAVQKIA